MRKSTVSFEANKNGDTYNLFMAMGDILKYLFDIVSSIISMAAFGLNIVIVDFAVCITNKN